MATSDSFERGNGSGYENPGLHPFLGNYIVGEGVAPLL